MNLGSKICARMGGKVRAYSHALGSSALYSASGITAMSVQWLKDERRSYIAILKSNSEATPRKIICKAWSGYAEGGTSCEYSLQEVARRRERKLPLPKKRGLYCPHKGT